MPPSHLTITKTTTGNAYHTPGRDLLLRGGQHGHYSNPRRPAPASPKAGQILGCDEGVRGEKQGSPRFRVYALSTSTADDRGQEGYLMDAGALIHLRSRRLFRVCSLLLGIPANHTSLQPPPPLAHFMYTFFNQSKLSCTSFRKHPLLKPI